MVKSVKIDFNSTVNKAISIHSTEHILDKAIGTSLQFSIM